jgi:hypothetical protein
LRSDARVSVTKISLCKRLESLSSESVVSRQAFGGSWQHNGASGQAAEGSRQHRDTET